MRNNSDSHNIKVVTVCDNERGFSLLELLIAMVIFLIMTGAIYGVLQLAQNSRSLVNQQVQLTKNVRVALNMIGRDTYNAGYGYPLNSTVVLPYSRISTLLNIPNGFDTTRDTVPPIIAGNNLIFNNYNTNPAVKTDTITLLFKDSTFNLVGPSGSEASQPVNINAATTVNGIDEIIPISGSNSACRINDILLITGNTGSALAVVTNLLGTDRIHFSNGDVLGFNQPGSLGPLRGITTPASMQKILMITYFVSTDGILTRREYANSTQAGGTPQKWSDEPVVYGVEDFQIKYILDDGSISDNPSAGIDGIPGTQDDEQAKLFKIRQVRFTINVKDPNPDFKGQPYRINMTSTFSTRNLGYDAN